MAADEIEKRVENLWLGVRLDADVIARTREHIHAELEKLASTNHSLVDEQRRRLLRLERQKQKLIDAYLLEAIPVEDLKPRQSAVQAEIADAKRLIEASELDHQVVRERIETVLELLGQADELYRTVTSEQRRWLNQALFEQILVDIESNEDGPTSDCKITTGQMAEPARTVVAIATGSGNEKTPGSLARTGGSNVDNLAETVGFEPTEEL